jgi:hypothetical protein
MYEIKFFDVTPFEAIVSENARMTLVARDIAEAHDAVVAICDKVFGFTIHPHQVLNLMDGEDLDNMAGIAITIRETK